MNGLLSALAVLAKANEDASATPTASARGFFNSDMMQVSLVSHWDLTAFRPLYYPLLNERVEISIDPGPEGRHCLNFATSGD